MPDTPHDDARTEALAATVHAESATRVSRTDQDLAAAAARLERGGQLGKYLVLDRLGVGGAGIVVAAFDPDLDRRVAIKVLRGHGSDAARARLIREAKALAQLNHPNVVTVHEVGTVDGELFVAMEFATGTLGAWLRASRRGWREILERFVDAGRGLAAAHAAKLVHRDFKPENVLVMADGRVKVSDFGLVGVTTSATEPSVDAPEPTGTLTQTGHLLGTPAYMAPEQHKLGRVDARADQFAFCVALYEALYGVRPFAGDDYDALVTSVSEGKLRPTPRTTEVPARIVRALARGLAPDPADRWESMDALLAALAPRRGSRRVPYVAAAIALVAVATGIVVVENRSVPEPPCGGGDRRLAGIWDAGTKQKIHAAFLASGAASSAGDWRRVEAIIDAYTSAWLDSHRDNCEATRVHADQSEDAFGLREACLDYRRTQLAGLTGMWTARIDGDVVRAASAAAVNLDALSICNDVSALSDRLPPPADEASTVAIMRIRGLLAEGRARTLAQKFVDAKAILAPLQAEADRVGYPPLVAEVELELARLDAMLDDERTAEELAFDAAVRAQASRHLEIATGAWSLLARLAVGQARTAEGEKWVRLARATATTFGDPLLEGLALAAEAQLRVREGKLDDGRARLVEAVAAVERQLVRARGDTLRAKHVLATVRGELGDVALRMGHSKEAEQQLQRAVAELDELYGPASMPSTYARNSLAGIYFTGGRYDEAKRIVEQVLAIASAHLPAPNATLASYHKNLGQLLERMEKYQDAAAHTRTAIGMQRALFGDDDLRLVSSYAALTEILDDQKRYAEARRYAELAVELSQRKLGDTSIESAVALLGLGQVLVAMRDHDGGIDAYRHALRIYQAVAPGHQDVAAVHSRIGTALHRAGKDREALVEHAEALARYERSDTPPADSIHGCLENLATSHVALHEPATAIPFLERALAMIEHDSAGAADRADDGFALARARWDAGLDRARAIREATAALAECDRAPGTCERGPIAGWLEHHRL